MSRLIHYFTGKLYSIYAYSTDGVQDVDDYNRQIEQNEKTKLIKLITRSADHGMSRTG